MASRRIPVVACVLSLALVQAAQSDVQLHGLFTDNMVLQQGIPVPVWGTADEGEEVTVQLCDQKVSGKAQDGKWMVKLSSLKAGGPHTMTVAGKTTIELENVLIGEVWVCSGQSNMAMSLGGCVDAEQVIADSANPMIRLYAVKRTTAETPQNNVEGAWKECGPTTVGGFSGVGYFFGRDLQEALGVPVGLVNSSWGGTPAEAWTSLSVLQADPRLTATLTRFDERAALFPKQMERYEQQMAKWRERTAKAKQAGRPATRQPRKPRKPRKPRPARKASYLYNSMIAPLIPYAIGGAIWYQGEGNAGQAYEYRALFPAMIQCWRDDWGQGDFPFFWAQLAAFMPIQSAPASTAWPELREAQTMTLSLPNTGMAVLTDVGNETDIHPRRKQEVGARLALAARAVAYGEDIVHSGPMYDSMAIDGNKATITFKHVGRGLTFNGDGLSPAPGTSADLAVRRTRQVLEKLKTGAAAKPDDKRAAAKVKAFDDRLQAAIEAAAVRMETEKQKRATGHEARNAEDLGSQVKGFAIAGADRKFVWANASIVGTNKVVVHSPKVEKPMALRYAWANYPICNLYNKEGLPAVPFRTDDFPMVTGPKPEATK